MRSSTSRDDRILRKIITNFDARDESLLAEFFNFLDDCVAHFSDSNDSMIKEIVDALQETISVVVTNREHPYSEAHSSLDLSITLYRLRSLYAIIYGRTIPPH